MRPVKINAAFAAPLAAALLLAATLPLAPRAAGAEKPVEKAANPLSSASNTNLPRIVWGGKNVLPTGTGAQTPFRDPSDGNVCIAPETLAPLGVTFMSDDDAQTVSLVGPSGTLATVPMRTPPPGTPSRGVFVGAVEAIEALGGKCQWDPSTNTLYARAILTGVEVFGGQMRVKATLPVVPQVTIDNGGKRVLIAFAGAEVGALPRALNLNAPNIAQARAGQFSDDVARIVLELRAPGGFRPLSDSATLQASTQVVLNPITAGQAMVQAVGSPTARTRAPKPRAPKSIAGTKKPVKVPNAVLNGVTFRKGSETLAQFVVSADRAPAFRAAQRKGQLTLDLLNTTLGAVSLGPLDGFANLPFVRSARMVARGSNAATLVLGLTRAVCFNVRPNANGGLLLELTLPRSAGGQLAGRTIVIDAGHGGGDEGARGVDGTHEKDVALSIAKNLADVLRDNGANVIMTRDDDTFIGLDERPRIANRLGADFFIAVHADSGDSNHSANGSTVYYHFDNAPCRTLASCISERLGDMGGIRSKGAHSDRTIAPNKGFAVLRGSQMVAVLCETGYMSNSSDVKLLNDRSMQKKIAQNIAQGLRDYIEGNPDFDTRNINPSAADTALGPIPDESAGDVPPMPDPSQMPESPENL